MGGGGGGGGGLKGLSGLFDKKNFYVAAFLTVAQKKGFFKLLFISPCTLLVGNKLN